MANLNSDFPKHGLTYAQARSLAAARVKEDLAVSHCRTRVLIYKDAGGNYAIKPIISPYTSVAYTSLKAIVYINLKGELTTETSRDWIGKFLEDMNVSAIYCKF